MKQRPDIHRHEKGAACGSPRIPAEGFSRM